MVLRFLALVLVSSSAWAASPSLPDAVEHQDRASIERLLESGAAVDQQQPDGMTALLWAARHDDLPLVRSLLKKGAAVDHTNRYGTRALALAAENGNSEMVEFLLESGADPNTAASGGDTPLMIASRVGKIASVQSLLSRAADPDAREIHGQTALMWACAEGHGAIVRLLLAKGADPAVELESGFTAFLFAVREGRLEAARALLAAGADPNTIVLPSDIPRGGVKPQTSALMLAVSNAHFEMAALLLDAGADPNYAGPGYTALHQVVSVRKPGTGDNDPSPPGSGAMSSLDFVRKLAAKGADLDARMTSKFNLGNTRLHKPGSTTFLLAAMAADAEMMRLLAELGADPNATNDQGTTALMAAAGVGTRSPGEDAGTEEEVLEAVQAALDLGADINAYDELGETAIHGAAYKNAPRVVEFLAARSDIEVWNRPNSKGWTPLAIARGYRYGNFKPSPPTIEVLEQLMMAAGAPIAPELHSGQSESEYK